MKIVYCGFGRAGLECFYQLVNSLNIEMCNVMVFTHDVEENREFITHLKNNNIVYFFDSINNRYEDLIGFKPYLLLSVYYRFIIKSEVLKLVNYRAMNLHPSILPAYRGTKSSVWTLINDEKETGISFHYITEVVDDGKIILQEKIDILETDTAYSLYNKLISLFVKNFPEALSRLINNDEGETQKGKVTYYKRELPFNGEKDFSTTTYEEAKRFVKAMYFPPYKGAFFSSIDHEKVEIRTVQELDSYKHLFRKIK
jgi:methionyl-tRNA formyltransferase